VTLPLVLFFVLLPTFGKFHHQIFQGVGPVTLPLVLLLTFGKFHHQIFQAVDL